MDVTGFFNGVAATNTEARVAEVIDRGWPFGANAAKKDGAGKAAAAKKAAPKMNFTTCTMYEISGDPEAQSEFGNDEIFTPKVNKRAKLADGVISAHVKPLSLSVFVVE